jgi:hypothetical protein
MAFFTVNVLRSVAANKISAVYNKGVMHAEPKTLVPD